MRVIGTRKHTNGTTWLIWLHKSIMLFRLYVFSFLLSACVAAICHELRQIFPIVWSQESSVMMYGITLDYRVWTTSSPTSPGPCPVLSRLHEPRPAGRPLWMPPYEYDLLDFLFFSYKTWNFVCFNIGIINQINNFFFLINCLAVTWWIQYDHMHHFVSFHIFVEINSLTVRDFMNWSIFSHKYAV